MNWLIYLLSSGLLLAGIVGWVLFILKWVISLQPQSPMSVAQKIYFEVEEQFFQCIPALVLKVIAANADLVRNTEQGPTLLSHALKSELEDRLSILSVARGQREQVYHYAQRRLFGLSILWVSLALFILFLLLALQVTMGADEPKVSVSHPFMLATSFLFLLLHGLAFWFSRHQTPLLNYALDALKGARNEFRI